MALAACSTALPRTRHGAAPSGPLARSCALLRAFAAAHAAKQSSSIHLQRVSKFSGSYVNRLVRGSSRKSCHAFGAALDFDADDLPMGQHFDEPQVHCHVSVKAEGMDGVRLNPRKADLQRWRERFAHELRERGVEAEATRRASRMHQQRLNKPWAVTRLEERGQSTNPAPAQPDAKRVDKWKETEKRAASSYDRIIEALHRSSDAADRVLAKELVESLVGQQARKNVRQDNRTKPDLERT